MTWTRVEQVPSGDQVEGWVSGARTADVDDAGEALAGDQDVARGLGRRAS